MRYVALACDYDGTLATQGQVADETVRALERVLATGRRLILVTGRQMPDLQTIFPHLGLFARIVAENGAILYRPAGRETKRLAVPPPEAFVGALRERRVEPLSLGEIIVATSITHEVAVLEVIRQQRLGLQVIYNKRSLMVLPPGVNKASGLAAALEELGLSAHNVVAIGDGENDHVLLRFCECGVAVPNAVALLQEAADYVTAKGDGAGVTELADRLVADDLHALDPRLTRHEIAVGTAEDGQEVRLGPYGANVLIAGPSGSGKSTLTTGILKWLADQAYQFCLVDPEGAYQGLVDVLGLGQAARPPAVAQVVKILEMPTENAVVNLRGVPLKDQAAFFGNLVPQLQALRRQSGRPHWLVVDEVEHLLSAGWAPAAPTLPARLEGTIMATVTPADLAPALLAAVDVLIAVGKSPEQTIQAFCRATGQAVPARLPASLAPGEAVIWFRRAGAGPFRFRVAPVRNAPPGTAAATQYSSRPRIR